MSLKVAEKIRTVIIILFLALVVVMACYPFVYMFSAAFADGNTMTSLSTVPFGNGFAIGNFVKLVTETKFKIWFINSLVISLCTMLGTLVICTISSYVISRFHFVGRHIVTTSMLVLQVIPSFLSMIAMYYVLYRIGGLDTRWGMILVYIAGNIPYNVWLVKTYFDALPISTDEAAMMDGAGKAVIFFKILIPSVRPILVFLAITSFTAPWVDFIFPQLLLRSQSKQTVALGLYELYNTQGDFGTFCAGAVLIGVPFFLFFLATQKRMIESMSTALDEDL